jgi:N-acetylglucosamine malate deacetylase 1
MKVLVVAPHPDDEAIGCGGTIVRHTQRGDVVEAVFLTSGELGLKHLAPEEAWKLREAEARRSCKVLGIQPPQFLRLPDWTMGDHLPEAAAILAPIMSRSRPDLIYLPHPGEWHPDHRASLPLLHGALNHIPEKPSAHEMKLRGYEVWTPLTEYHYVEDITPVMATKLRALRKHVSQVKDWDYVRAIRGLNEFRGAMAGRCRYAEVFLDLPLGT